MINIKVVTPVNLIALNEENKILLIKRVNEDADFGGYWSIPGGGIESKETFEEALVREVKEELILKL